MNTPILVVLGTRPEAVKLAPVIRRLHRHPELTPVVAVTGQHQEMSAQVLNRFGITPDFDLALHSLGQPLNKLAARALSGLDDVLAAVDPAAVIVQGDTTTTFVASLAAFYARRRLVHLEAGLRTTTLRDPFPEEANRRLTSRIADLHLAATSGNRNALVAEGVKPATIVVTGNTVIDALLEARAWDEPWDDPDLSAWMARTAGQRIVLVTAHRRESWGEPLSCIARAVASLSDYYPDVHFVWPLHANPAVRGWVEPVVDTRPNVLVTGPATYADFVRLLAGAHLALTDSGGVQEEAPALDVPVLVTRNVTERQEAIDAGGARLVGTDQRTIVRAVRQLLDDPDEHAAMATSASPYGDGRAAERVIGAVAAMLGLGERLPEFAAATADAHAYPIRRELVAS